MDLVGDEDQKDEEDEGVHVLDLQPPLTSQSPLLST